jgi:D-alanyl-D-alanine dipeptidase
VDFLALCSDLHLDRPRFRYRRATLLRRTVAEKLCAAAELLPNGVRLNIIEGWRAPHIQARMYRTIWNRWQEQHPDWSEATLRRIVNRFSAPVDDPRAPPPHTTGGAVDLILADATGEPLDLSFPYDAFDPRSYPFAAPGLSEMARRNRDLLRVALEAVNITNYPSEYWHWSYGDQGWAYRGGHPHAVYGAVTPPDWTPDPEELVDAPLEVL